MGADEDYERLVRDAESAHRDGWDFGWLHGRADGSDPSWSYAALAREAVSSVESLLDIDTGGGEFLADLAPLPARTVATEAWAPNVPLARRRLEPLGVSVAPARGDRLPFADGSFELVLDRHGLLAADEIARVLAAGGRLLTQQVGDDDCEELNRMLGAPRGHAAGSWDLRRAVSAVERAGLVVRVAGEERPELTFADVGAIVFQLQMVPWQIPDFTPQRYDAPLRRLHRRLRTDGPITVAAHRFLLDAVKPVGAS